MQAVDCYEHEYRCTFRIFPQWKAFMGKPCPRRCKPDVRRGTDAGRRQHRRSNRQGTENDVEHDGSLALAGDGPQPDGKNRSTRCGRRREILFGRKRERLRRHRRTENGLRPKPGCPAYGRVLRRRRHQRLPIGTDRHLALLAGQRVPALSHHRTIGRHLPAGQAFRLGRYAAHRNAPPAIGRKEMAGRRPSESRLVRYG